MENGYVLVMSEWDDGAAHMLWLDSNYPPDADPSKPAGLYTAWMVFGQKLIIGLTMSVFGSLLSLTGYISSQGDCSGALSFIEQPDSALLAIRLCMGLIPAILVLLGLVVMRGWPDRGAHLQKAAG